MGLSGYVRQKRLETTAVETKVAHTQQYSRDYPEIPECRDLSRSLLQADQSFHLHSVEKVRLFLIIYFIKAANRQSEPAKVRG